MLFKAFLACGALHQQLVNSSYTDEYSLPYYSEATELLRIELSSVNCDRALCATTSVVLSVYDIMSVSTARMNHIGGCRALMMECGWNAQSTGVAAACFWLHVGMDLLSCLHQNKAVGWDPDGWGLDLNWQNSVPETRNGVETLWTYRIVYIVTKITNFRANMQSDDLQSLHPQKLMTEWHKLKALADDWEQKIPKTMRPMVFVSPQPNHPNYSPHFSKIWLPERTSVLARIFYHTGMIWLAKSHPYANSSAMQETDQLCLRHARHICGIVRNVEDR
jgi:hypothetical protein